MSEGKDELLVSMVAAVIVLFLVIGLAVGTYSSIGVASQFLIRRRLLATA